MTNPNTETAPTAPPVPLAVLAIELGEPIEAIERDLAGHVFTAGGLRAVTSFQAAQLLEQRAKQKAEDERRRAEQSERLAKFVARKHAETPKGFTKFELGRTTIDVDPDVPAVVKMTAGAAVEYEGGTYTKRPGHLDWLTGAAEGGEAIGPTPGAVLKAAMQRRDERKAAKSKGDPK